MVMGFLHIFVKLEFYKQLMYLIFYFAQKVRNLIYNVIPHDIICIIIAILWSF